MHPRDSDDNDYSAYHYNCASHVKFWLVNVKHRDHFHSCWIMLGTTEFYHVDERLFPQRPLHHI